MGEPAHFEAIDSTIAWGEPTGAAVVGEVFLPGDGLAQS
jgi:hypothetical protein